MDEIQYADQEITGESLVLDHIAFNTLGPNLTLIDCKVAVKSASRRFFMLSCTMTGGEFRMRQTLTNFKFSGGTFRNVYFYGNYSGVDFGRVTEGFGEYLRDNGGLENCDLSGARMNFCRFYDTEFETTKFPIKDHVLFDQRSGLDPEWEKIDKEALSFSWQRAFVETTVEDKTERLSGFVMNIPDYAKKKKIETSVARDFLLSLPNAKSTADL